MVKNDTTTEKPVKKTPAGREGELVVAIRIGYACIAVGVPHTQLRTCTLKNATPALLHDITQSNLTALDHMLDYNIVNNIKLFRISSDIIPFGSHPEVPFEWRELFQNQLAALGRKARDAGMRLSMHPGQYTVLNSPNEDVVKRAVEDLEYHCNFLDSLSMSSESKIILHIGGAYGEKETAVGRFIENYQSLSEPIRQRLVIENDDKIYSISEVLSTGQALSIPVVFDNLHNSVLPAQERKTDAEWIDLCGSTWQSHDGPQKIHYSQQAEGKKMGSHSATIKARAFVEYAAHLPQACDVMLEVKDKNLSAVKCLLATSSKGTISDLEREWARYKYAVLERSPQNYLAIRVLLKDKAAYPVLEFYELIEDSMATVPEKGTAENAAQHVWGYVKDLATPTEKRRFETLLTQYRKEPASLRSVKNHLFKLAENFLKST